MTKTKNIFDSIEIGDLVKCYHDDFIVTDIYKMKDGSYYFELNGQYSERAEYITEIYKKDRNGNYILFWKSEELENE